MKDCSPNVAPIVKSDMLNLNQCPKNNLEKKIHEKYSIYLRNWNSYVY